MLHTIALFGEAEKGEYQTAYYCRSLDDLVNYLGQPPSDSLGVHYAIQALMYQRELLFIRVREEGFSIQDYLNGIQLLENQHIVRQLSAICLPNVGDGAIIDASTPLCRMYRSILITTEADLYDYLTSL
jgi:hypothetical protein